MSNILKKQKKKMKIYSYKENKLLTISDIGNGYR